MKGRHWGGGTWLQAWVSEVGQLNKIMRNYGGGVFMARDWSAALVKSEQK